MPPFVGQPLPRLEDKRFITGAGRYVDDIRLDRQTHATFVRSPHAHAKINGIDLSEAKAAPGVVAIFVGGDMKGIGPLVCGWTVHSKDGSPMNPGVHPALAEGKTRYVGDNVAIVIAETHAQAKDAAELVKVDYEPLPAITDLATARDDGAALVHDDVPHNTSFDWEIGDAAAADAAEQAAAHTTHLHIVNNRLAPNAMEPRAAIGAFDPGTGDYTLYTTSQNPHVARLVLSAFHGIAPESHLRVVAPDVGGGFGSKIFIYAEEVVCLWATAKIGGRPIKWTGGRDEAFMADAHGRDHITDARLSLDAEGKILGLKVRTTANMGAYLSTFASSVPTYLYATLLSGQYAIPTIYAEVAAVFTNTSPVDAYRGAGRPEACFVVERLIEQAAREMNLAPEELRRRNFVREFPHQTPVIMAYDAGDFDASLTKAYEMMDMETFPARRAEAEGRGMLRGVGYSSYIEACGIAPSAAVGSLGAGVGLWESATVRVHPTGEVEAMTGSHSHGQGHETTFAQLTADKLGVDINKVRIVHGDTARIQFGMGTYGSRSGAVGMTALSKALDKVETKAKRIASRLLETSEEDIEFKDGVFSVAGSDKSLAFGEVAFAAYTAHGFDGAETEPGLEENAFHDPSNFTFPAGCHICEVEIDPATGVSRIVKWVAVDDFGEIINPLIVEGQVHGGVVQGIGQAMLERVVYDDSGQLITASYMDYAMPRADDVPHMDLAFTKTVCPSNPLGIKGCGEAGAIAAPAAVINAITDAVKAPVSMPATPEVVWRALRETPNTSH